MIQSIIISHDEDRVTMLGAKVVADTAGLLWQTNLKHVNTRWR